MCRFFQVGRAEGRLRCVIDPAGLVQRVQGGRERVGHGGATVPQRGERAVAGILSGNGRFLPYLSRSQAP